MENYTAIKCCFLEINLQEREDCGISAITEFIGTTLSYHKYL